jgi:hypothetical protein
MPKLRHGIHGARDGITQGNEERHASFIGCMLDACDIDLACGAELRHQPVVECFEDVSAGVSRQVNGMFVRHMNPGKAKRLVGVNLLTFAI